MHSDDPPPFLEGLTGDHSFAYGNMDNFNMRSKEQAFPQWPTFRFSVLEIRKGFVAVIFVGWRYIATAFSIILLSLFGQCETEHRHYILAFMMPLFIGFIESFHCPLSRNNKRIKPSIFLHISTSYYQNKANSLSLPQKVLLICATKWTWTALLVLISINNQINSSDFSAISQSEGNRILPLKIQHGCSFIFRDSYGCSSESKES